MANEQNQERSQFDSLLQRLIWLLVVAVLGMGPLLTGMVRAEDFIWALWLTMGAVLVWVLRIWCSSDYRVFWPPIAHGVLAFVAYAVWRYTQSPIEYVARQEMIKVLVYAALFVVIVANFQRQEASHWIAFTLIFVATAVSMYAICQFVTKSEMVWSFSRPAAYQGRASGTYMNPNHLAGFLEMTLPLAISLTLAGRYSVVMKIMLGYATLVILTGLMLTISRGGWLAAGVGCGFLFIFWLFQTRERWTPALLIGGALCCVAAVAFTYARNADVRQNRLAETRQYNDVRYKLWPAAISIWKEDPWFGGGLDHFDHRFPKYRIASDQLAGRPERVHNDYLNTLADWGVVGAGIIAYCLGALGWGFLKSWRYLQRNGNDLSGNRNSNRAALSMGAMAGVVAILAHSLFDFNMHIPANAITAICLMAMVSAALRYTTDRSWLSGALWSRLLVTMPLIGWGAYLTPEAIKLTKESRELSMVSGVKYADAIRLRYLKQAFQVDPMNPKTVFEIGDHYWRESSEGSINHETLGKEAIEWFELAIKLNPFDPTARVRFGMCLDWLGRHDEAGPYFEQALSLDPNGFSTVGHMGWHLFQIGRYADARKWFEKSQGLYPADNPLAYTYLKLIDKKLAEGAK
ncbi:MAG: O-antigen ligase family protein [Verrucomicrobia bacterium]|nr:O-antigen ligase family protein [Verrucomicrobiota bacterium]MBI3866989.1 O-antigen ligase family protein [Verrucomicrobiota bacterium]